MDFTPIFAKKMDFGLGGLKISVANFDHLLVIAYPEIWAKSELVEFLADFGGFYSLFCQKLVFGLGKVNFVVTNFDHLLVLAYPENLSQI